MAQLIWSWDDGEYSKGPRMVLTSSRDGLRSLLAARIPPQLWKETEAGKQTEQKPARLKYIHIDASGETSSAPALPPYTHPAAQALELFKYNCLSSVTFTQKEPRRLSLPLCSSVCTVTLASPGSRLLHPETHHFFLSVTKLCPFTPISLPSHLYPTPTAP